jgi:hypothetical protein
MYGYDVKIRGTMYLWGSKGIGSNLEWPLLLTLRNDIAGDSISLQSETADGHKSTIGTLAAGECCTLPLLGLRGILATCDQDSSVACVILIPHIGPSA